MSDPRSCSADASRGFALLVLLGIVGVGSLGILLAVQAFVPPLAGQSRLASERLATADAALRVAFRRQGSNPTDLTALASSAGLATDGAWRLDPYGRAQDFDYRVLGSGARLRSRGVDARLGTADDVQIDVSNETATRDRQRGRLRLLRALLVRSPYRFAASMSGPEQMSMRDASNDYAQARRSWLTATASERAVLTTRMNAASTTINTLVALHGCAALPPALTGAGGLMQQIGAADAAAIDGQGHSLQAQPVLGVIATGNDHSGGTDDDM